MTRHLTVRGCDVKVSTDTAPYLDCFKVTRSFKLLIGTSLRLLKDRTPPAAAVGPSLCYALKSTMLSLSHRVGGRVASPVSCSTLTFD